MLALDSVSRSFDGQTVFDDVSLAVDPGEVLGIIGPSGVGKTTLLRLFGLFEQPDGGQVTYDGTDVWGVSEDERLALRRNVGMVFQNASLFSTSVRRNAAYGLRVRRSWGERLRSEVAALVGRQNGTHESVQAALETVGLAEKADQNARSLSGGEAQRVAFARALAYDPEVVLLDEPTSDLDPRNTAVIEDAVSDARRRGIGVVIATHDMNQAERVADRVAVMFEGGVVEVGPTERIFESPRDRRTQQFIDGELVY